MLHWILALSLCLAVAPPAPADQRCDKAIAKLQANIDTMKGTRQTKRTSRSDSAKVMLDQAVKARDKHDDDECVAAAQAGLAELKIRK